MNTIDIDKKLIIVLKPAEEKQLGSQIELVDTDLIPRPLTPQQQLDDQLLFSRS